MRVNLEQNSVQQRNKFSRLGTTYIVALSAIALVAIVGQALIQVHLHRQLADSEVVNVAGRQRMLSQNISKSVLKLDGDEDYEIIEDLRRSVEMMSTSQEALIHGSDSLGIPGNNSEEVKQLFATLDPSYQAIISGAREIISAYDLTRPNPFAMIDAPRQRILDREAEFLLGMNSIVGQYALEAHDRVSTLSKIEYILVAVALLVILLEIVFVFRPTAQQVTHAVEKLTDSEKNARKLSKEIGALYASLEKSYQQIAVVNQPADNPRLFAKSDRGGNITFISETFRVLVKKPGDSELHRFCDLFSSIEDADEWMDEMIDRVSDGISWRGELSLNDTEGNERMFEVIITPVFGETQEVDELVMAGSEITHHKIAEQSMLQKNMAEIEKTINQQKFRSVLILEGQEEERKRIAMDIHDGIGQMLTSLKFQIESIDLSNESKAGQKIQEIELLIRDVIREVRKVTFDLKPTVLGDYGLQAGLNVFITEIKKLNSIDMEFDSVGEIGRIPQKIENNTFRIIQEAINNAIKYSGATKIKVTLSHTDSELVARVHDDGRGFDTRMIDARSINIESGRGFFNMYERTEYMSGRLEINSSPGMGTTVELTVPIHSQQPKQEIHG